ncbi:MAG TPA: tyrosine-type recombinase/integrase [Bryobacteraceae bacterium]|nr:tyrosine-type recombinase/integrase [Bryobacteraceae bacterium]
MASGNRSDINEGDSTNQTAVIHCLPPELSTIKTLVVNAVRSPHSKSAYGKALDDFLTWYAAGNSADGFTKATVQRYVTFLQDTGLAPSSINLRLSVIRKLAFEAADNNLMDTSLAQGIARAKGVKQSGIRTGNWLMREQAEHLINAPNIRTRKGLRDRAILAVLIGCGLRRSEVSDLTFEHIQQREGRWVIVDLVGKGRRTRSVPMPSWAKAAIDAWSASAEIGAGRVFRPVNIRHALTRDRLLPQNIMELVARYGRRIDVTIGPHDLRRTFAKLAHRGRAPLEQIQLSLGHASIQTTERYLGVRQDFEDAPCDHLGLRIRSLAHKSM